jgi:hypothetical protein
LTCLLATPAAASHGEGTHVGAVPNAFEGHTGGGGNGGSGGGGGSAQPISNNESIFTVGLGETEGPNGGSTPCWRVETGGNQTLGEAAETVSQFDDNGTLYDACPGRRGPSLSELVEAAFERWSPSPVSAEIDPGYAITGLKAYLVLGDATPSTISLVGQSVSLATEYRIRWGDGAETTTSSKGVPYPGGPGEIVHVYRDSEDLAVQVDLVVRGSWNGRDLGALAPVTTTLPLEVWQVQAVRKR